jgi:hypothetical protein
MRGLSLALSGKDFFERADHLNYPRGSTLAYYLPNQQLVKGVTVKIN